MPRYIFHLRCRGCSFETQSLIEAADHDDSDKCRRMGDREAEGWDLDRQIIKDKS